MSKFIKSCILFTFGFVLATLALLTLLDYIFPLNTALLNKVPGKTLYGSNQEVLYEQLAPDHQWRFNLPKEGASKAIKEATVLYEDRFFYYHPGINPFSIVRAIIHNLNHSRKIGASTITMQVARMMQARERTIQSKLIEGFRALQLERLYSKEEVLDLYLSLAPYGGNLEGIEAASRYYFEKCSSKLNVLEASYLAMIPKNPNKNGSKGIKPPGHLEKARIQLMARLDSKGLVPADLKQSELRLSQHRFPRNAPHYFHAHAGNEDRIYSAIVPRFQNRLEELLRRRSIQLAHLKIEQGAALLLENSTGDILSWVGSLEYDDQKALGANDGVLARKSPGSLLKPFIYALAYESGLITPEQMLLDIPLHFDSYSPRNFDSKYRAWVSASNALKDSLNIPAVEINALLHRRDLYDFLRESQLIRELKPRSYYGHSLALGTLDTNLVEIARLYSILANRGKLGMRQLLREESSWLVAKTLAHESFHEMNPGYSMKTGTSANSKDLWSVAWNHKYTLILWMGDFQNYRRDKISARSALQNVVEDFLLFLRQEDDAQTTSYLAEKPSGLRPVKTCQSSLVRDPDDCRAWVDDYIIASAPSQEQCQLLSTQKIDYWVKTNRIDPSKELKAHVCATRLKKLEPVLQQPRNESSFTLSRLLPKSQQRTTLQCYSANPLEQVHFFVNGRYTATTNSGNRLLIDLPTGKNTIECMDSKSQMTQSQVTLDYQL